MDLYFKLDFLNCFGSYNKDCSCIETSHSGDLHIVYYINKNCKNEICFHQLFILKELYAYKENGKRQEIRRLILKNTGQKRQLNSICPKRCNILFDLYSPHLICLE